MQLENIDFSKATVTDIVPPGVFELRGIYPEFWESFPAGEPIYAMPAPLIKAAEIMAKEWNLDWTAERAFSTAAARSRQVGFWGLPIPCEYPLYPGTTPSEDRAWNEASEAGEDLHTAQRRIVGTLLTCSEYLVDLSELKQLFVKFPELHNDLVFPFTQHPLPVASLSWREAAKTAPAPADQFIAKVRAFLAKWQLSCMVTWDLPFPLVPGPTFYPPNSVAAPEGVVTMQLPATLDLTGKAKAELLRAIERELGAKAKETRTPSSFKEAASNRSKEGEFWVAWFERIVRSRFAKRRTPVGFEQKLKSVLSQALDVSEDEIKKRMNKLRAARRSAK